MPTRHKGWGLTTRPDKVISTRKYAREKFQKMSVRLMTEYVHDVVLPKYAKRPLMLPLLMHHSKRGEETWFQI
jgi:hypothetical protein